jgi:hypothetical protein
MKLRRRARPQDRFLVSETSADRAQAHPAMAPDRPTVEHGTAWERTTRPDGHGGLSLHGTVLLSEDTAAGSSAAAGKGVRLLKSIRKLTGGGGWAERGPVAHAAKPPQDRLPPSTMQASSTTSEQRQLSSVCWATVVSDASVAVSEGGR